MTKQKKTSEVRAALMRLRKGLLTIVAISIVINLMAITGSIYLILVYDRVLPSQSLATLFSIFAIIALIYLFYGCFDVMRSKMLADVAASLDRSLCGRAQALEAQLALERPQLRDSVSPVRDLDQLRSFIASPGPPALIDLPSILFFLLILSLVHYWLGLVTLAGIVMLGGLTLVAERVSARHVSALSEAMTRRRALGARQLRHAEVASALGMRDRLMLQWRQAHHTFLDQQAILADSSSTLSGISKVARLFLQSAVLTVGAVLVIDGKASVGVIFASSILSGRALAPVDQAIAHWKNFFAARQSWARLDSLLGQATPEAAERFELPAPVASLAVRGLTLSPPGQEQVVVGNVSFTLQAGAALGIIGPSASGKSSLVRGLVGVWKPLRGAIQLDGAALTQWDSETLGRHIGYLPQSVDLFAGTVAQNIARFEIGDTAEAVLHAARAAGVHDMIVQLPKGYDTPVGEDGQALSAGQRQRIALARALYRDPFLIVLDEPNSNLDSDGDVALARAIAHVKARQGIVIVVAHRRETLGQIDMLMVLNKGAMLAFGPRDEVLARLNNPVQP